MMGTSPPSLAVQHWIEVDHAVAWTLERRKLEGRLRDEARILGEAEQRDKQQELAIAARRQVRQEQEIANEAKLAQHCPYPNVSAQEIEHRLKLLAMFSTSATYLQAQPATTQVVVDEIVANTTENPESMEDRPASERPCPLAQGLKPPYNGSLESSRMAKGRQTLSPTVVSPVGHLESFSQVDLTVQKTTRSPEAQEKPVRSCENASAFDELPPREPSKPAQATSKIVAKPLPFFKEISARSDRRARADVPSTATNISRADAGHRVGSTDTNHLQYPPCFLGVTWPRHASSGSALEQASSTEEAGSQSVPDAQLMNYGRQKSTPLRRTEAAYVPPSFDDIPYVRGYCLKAQDGYARKFASPLRH
jgi:hypothetical protein